MTLELHGTQYRCLATLKNPDIRIESQPVTLGVGLGSPSVPFRFDASGDFAWRIATEPGRSYRLFMSLDLKSWTVVDTQVANDEELMFEDKDGEAPVGRFYKVESF